MKNDLYTTVTNKIIAELETGAAPWVQPWSGMALGSRSPANATSGRAYSGINILLLWGRQQECNFSSARWLTFKQALEIGGNVRKGEKGTTVCYVNTMIKKAETESGDSETRRIPFLKAYTVFNVEQCEKLPEHLLPVPAEAINKDDRNSAADVFINNTGATFGHGGARAYYRPSDDSVTLPPFETFLSADHYYATAYHELGHWTGHKSRLARSMRARFGDQAYAAEELIAELTAAYICAEQGFDGDVRHAAYIEGWIKLLKSDKRAIFTAAAKAQQAATLLNDLQCDHAERAA